MSRSSPGCWATLAVAAVGPAALALMVVAGEDSGDDIGVGPIIFVLPIWVLAVLLLFLPLTFFATRTDGLMAGLDSRVFLAGAVLASQALAASAYALLDTGRVTTTGVLVAAALTATCWGRLTSSTITQPGTSGHRPSQR